jgi:hypothetical protein
MLNSAIKDFKSHIQKIVNSDKGQFGQLNLNIDLDDYRQQIKEGILENSDLMHQVTDFLFRCMGKIRKFRSGTASSLYR